MGVSLRSEPVASDRFFPGTLRQKVPGGDWRQKKAISTGRSRVKLFFLPAVEQIPPASKKLQSKHLGLPVGRGASEALGEGWA